MRKIMKEKIGYISAIATFSALDIGSCIAFLIIIIQAEGNIAESAIRWTVGY